MKKAVRLIALAGVLTTSWLLTEPPSLAIVSCSFFEGQPCTGTSHPRCLLAPGEPGTCVCRDGTYLCR
jgi:hypothetical protein